MCNIFGILYFTFSRKIKTLLKHTHTKICAVCGEDAVMDWMWQKWFAKFCARDFLLDNIPWSGRPGEVGSDQI